MFIRERYLSLFTPLNVTYTYIVYFSIKLLFLGQSSATLMLLDTELPVISEHYLMEYTNDEGIQYFYEEINF